MAGKGKQPLLCPFLFLLSGFLLFLLPLSQTQSSDSVEKVKTIDKEHSWVCEESKINIDWDKSINQSQKGDELSTRKQEWNGKCAKLGRGEHRKREDGFTEQQLSWSHSS